MKRFLLVLMTLALVCGLAWSGGQGDGGETAAPGVTGMFDEAASFATPAEYETATGKKLGAYSEAPSLAEMVKAGQLPPVEQRLPMEPAVRQPWDAIGKYGGSISVEGIDSGCVRAEHILEIIAPNFSAPVPNVAKGYELSADSKKLTLYLREGLKWSDGVDLTADDFVFWYEDFLGNDELNPAKPKIYSPGGELMKLRKIDDYTVEYSFNVPYPIIVDVLGSDEWWRFPIMPKHYFEQYHPKYNPKAGELAKSEGFDNWFEAFLMHKESNQNQQDLDRPVINAWSLAEIDSAGNKYYDRNPYYWAVDVAGNQLPYIDEMIMVKADNDEVKKLKVISGELHIGGTWQNIIDFPLYKDGEAAGGYTAMLWDDPRGSMATGLTINQTSKDPRKRQLFSDIRFRQAMSLAIDRDDLNEAVFVGKGIPRQASPPGPPSNTLYEDWMGEYYADFDVDQANKLLDEVGMKWDAKREYRLHPDGKPFSFVYEYTQRQAKSGPLLTEYWSAIGLNVAPKEVARAAYSTRRSANEVDLAVWSIENTEFTTRREGYAWALPPYTGNNHPWRVWLETNGGQGEEPPVDVKEIAALRDKWMQTVPGTDEYQKLGTDIAGRFVKGLYVIGAVGIVPYPVVMSNKLGNQPKVAFWSPSYQQWVPYRSSTWYFK